MTAEDRHPMTRNYRRGERLSHALYGLIIIAATLVAEKGHVDEASHALGLILGTGFILLLAHTYTAIVAVRVVESTKLGTAHRRRVIRDNLPILFAIVVPSALFIFAWFGVVTLQAAYTASIVFSLVALFGLGVFEGRMESMNWALSVLAGFAAGTIGVIVVVLETLLD